VDGVEVKKENNLKVKKATFLPQITKQRGDKAKVQSAITLIVQHRHSEATYHLPCVSFMQFCNTVDFGLVFVLKAHGM
jgi:hypothetical protein